MAAPVVSARPGEGAHVEGEGAKVPLQGAGAAAFPLEPKAASDAAFFGPRINAAVFRAGQLEDPVRDVHPFQTAGGDEDEPFAGAGVLVLDARLVAEGVVAPVAGRRVGGAAGPRL
jgi:hypothetical protein